MILNSGSPFQITIQMDKHKKETRLKDAEVSVKTIEVKTFKARFKASKPHFIKKVIGHKEILKDGFNPRFNNYMTCFIPTITPQYQKPCVMLQIGNGNSSTIVRAKNPIAMAEWLEASALTLRSNAWLDKWEELASLSHSLIYGTDPTTLDEQFMDVKEFERAFIEKGKDMCNYAKEK